MTDTTVVIDAILEARDDGRFVVVYNGDQIATLGYTTQDLSKFATPLECYLAGIASSRLVGAPRAVVGYSVVETEEL